MANWIDIGEEFDRISSTMAAEDAYTQIRHNYVKSLHEQTGRNVITYYSGWTQHPNLSGTEINETDKTAFMTLTQGLDHGAGLDLFLHTPGGNIAATESIIDFLRDVYKRDIRAFVMQLAMSAGTMIACACRKILMGRQSSLGPVDPQMQDMMPAHSILHEFEQAKQDIISNPNSRYVWQYILEQYYPTFINQCKQSIKWSKEIVTKSLAKNMFKMNKKKARKIARILTDASKWKVHDRHLSLKQCKKIGLNVQDVYELAGKNYKLKDTIYAIHFANIHTLEAAPIMKIIESHEGRSVIRQGDK